MAGTSKDELNTYGSVIIVQEDGDTRMSAEEDDNAHSTLLCEECGGTFPEKSSLETHLKTHRNDFSYECNLCQLGFWDINDYESHLLEHERKDSSAHEEKEKLPVSEANSSNVEQTKNKKYYSCDICNQIFSFNNSLKRHKKIMHKIDVQYLTSRLKNKQRSHKRHREKLSCDSCDATFAFKGSLRKHVESEHKDVIHSFKCYYCFKEFKGDGKLRLHMKKMHCWGKFHKHHDYEDRKRFPCRLCGLKFIYKRSLTRHLNHKHKVDREKTRCSHCDQEFQSIYYLYKHIRSVHIDLMLKCKECSLPFRNMATLWRHMKVHRVQLKNQSSKVAILNTQMSNVTTTSETSSVHSDSGVSVEQEYGRKQHIFKSENLTFLTDVQDKMQTKVFSCQFCKEKFTKHKQLRNHQNTAHFTEYFTLQCSQCSRLFENNHDMIFHMRTVHYEHKINNCGQCDMIFGLKGCPLKCLKPCASRKKDILNLIIKDFHQPSSPESTKEENTEDSQTAFEHFVCEDSEDPFNYEATKLLIDGMQSRYDRMASVHRRPLVYQEVGEELMRYGYNISAQDIKKKWCKIVSYFWSLRNRPDSQNWEFFEQLSTFLEVEDQSSMDSDDNFDRDSILALIECVKKRYSVFSQTNLHDRHAVYADICKELKTNGQNFSVPRIKRKWNYLISKYKQEKEKEYVTEMWEYFEPMNDFLDPGSSGPALREMTRKKVEKVLSSSSMSKASGSSTKKAFVFTPPSTTINVASASPAAEKSTSNSIAFASGVNKRLKMMEDYFTFLKEKDCEDRKYRGRKEKRSRMKLRILGKIGTQLEAIAHTQNDILREQNKILSSLKEIRGDET